MPARLTLRLSLKHEPIITLVSRSCRIINPQKSFRHFSHSSSSSSNNGKSRNSQNSWKDSFETLGETLFNTKSIWKPIPISLGIAFLAGMQFMRSRRRAIQEAENRPVDEDLMIEGPLQIRMYAALPLRAASRLFGYINSLTVPTFLRETLYGTYARAFGCDLDEMESPSLKDFPNLGEFFYRTLKPGARPMNESTNLVSPADGRVLNFGKIENSRIAQVKGATYSLGAFMGRYSATPEVVTTIPKQITPKPGNALFSIVIYLAPGDYHRYHSPADWSVQARRHFAGELLSVSPMIVEKIRNLFILNERVALMGTWRHGFFSMTPVGATNVGGIRINFDPELATNLPEPQTHPLGTYTERDFTNDGKGLPLKKGDEVGGFRLGSSIVLVFEAPESFKFAVTKNEKLKVGQKLGNV